MQKLEWTYDSVDMELHLVVLDDQDNILYSEDIIGVEEDEQEQTALEVARGQGFDPLTPAQIAARTLGREGGKKSAEVRKKLGHDSKYYSELAKKRWTQANR
jgi:hypothetical protein